MDKIEQLQDLVDQSQRIVFFGGQECQPSLISQIFVVQMVFIVIS